jgi:hypothetical protein
MTRRVNSADPAVYDGRRDVGLGMSHEKYRSLVRTLSLVCVVVTGCVRPEDTACLTQPQGGMFEVGVTHVAGAYQPTPDIPFLTAGAKEVSRLGLRAIKVYLTPEYQKKYPHRDWPKVHSLTELAQTPAFRALFDAPFDTYVLTTYTFANGVGDGWRTRDDDALYESEAAELESLTRHLLATYGHTGKRFVFQTWEGDWAYLGDTDPLTRVPPERAGRMARWLNARQRGINRARRDFPTLVRTVRNVVEVNLVLDDTGSRVLNEVLPQTCVEAVSYSAWEALAVDVAQPLAEQLKRVAERLTQAVQRIRNVVGDAEVSFGEVGFAEHEHPAGHVAPLLQRTLETAEREKVARVMYWQVYDNECVGLRCRGLWVVRPDASWSEAALTLRQSSAIARSIQRP